MPSRSPSCGPGRAAALAMLACACDAADAAGPERGRSLTGTTWRLVEIQSPNDAVGTTRPVDPARYTLRFNEEGPAEVRLDCNHGAGKWSSEPRPPGLEGEIAIGPLAVTRALCPPPSIGEELARDIGFVRSFRIEDDRLYLSQTADGGTFVWEAE